MTTAPYYQDDHVTLFHGDCLELADVWTGADVLVTDPPYGMAYQSGHRPRDSKMERIAGDATPDIRDRMLRVWTTAGEGARPGILFGTWRVAPPAGERQRLIWHKGATPGMGDLTMPWGTSHEEIHVIGTGWDRESTGQKRSSSIITCQARASGAHGEATQFGHPTPKPVALMESLILRCPPGVIADPFAGSGSTLVAARNLGRRAIGVELEERYCELIAQRLSQGALDLNI